ncbi:polysaccharide biosynthesis/export family protein [Azorhizobium doebereinerae]|uniref:polysaccharide biosynthesis/export family protein n=1 Tax=Azorhizobium doebereinerae TaxID=281091 RepID=UPI00041B4B02|nr:polysaccharide biosynthesis/export family protein [Azorhizobium doebereinerae]
MVALLASSLTLGGCTTTAPNPAPLSLADAGLPAASDVSAYASASDASWQGAVKAPGSPTAAMIYTAPATSAPRDSGQTPFATGHNISFTEVNPQGFRPWVNVPTTYRLGPGDKLKVKFFITRDMDEDVTVSPDGTIGLRAAGQLRVEGMSLAGVQDMIRRASRNDLTDQKVVISLEDAVSSKIYVGGMVAHPGSYRLTDLRLNALQAVLLAGGVTDEARLGQIAVIRRGLNNAPMLRTMNLRDVIEGAYDEGEVQLVAGDIIYVPRSSIAELDLWIDQFINKVVPFQRSFSYTLGSYSTSTSGGTIIP